MLRTYIIQGTGFIKIQCAASGNMLSALEVMWVNHESSRASEDIITGFAV